MVWACSTTTAAEEEMVGSPLEALLIPRPFDRYVFSDFNAICVDALQARVEAGGYRRRSRTVRKSFVRKATPTTPSTSRRCARFLDPKALVIAYLDPAKPNLHWTTVEYLAERFRRLDLLINLPFSAIHRALSVGHTRGPSLMLNEHQPMRFLTSDEGRASMSYASTTGTSCGNWASSTSPGEPSHTCATRSPLYDVILASRNDRAVDLFEKANKVTESGQLGIF